MEVLQNIDEKQMTKVSRLHLLIHPGFSHPQNDDIFPSNSNDDPRKAIAEELLDSYITRAETFQSNEIMIAMLYEGFHNLLFDFRTGQEYTRRLSQLKNVLGTRLIALSNDQDIGQDASYWLAESIAKKRGFHIPSDLYSEAYGETLEVCVPEAAHTANQSLQLEKKTVLNPIFTNNPLLSERGRKIVLDCYDRVQFIVQKEMW